ncbi:hypothetical protein [Acinetobacter pittii]|uniref:hypothetical protein n=1 Tax=Acinetobacter pittii TaxID=48296 RepID=UPI00123C725D|nr:hypothetical protein [Acinetobacter pittii]QRF07524.1 hypothetical protein HRJ47_05815 [Acinetobacter pittii]
MGWTNKPSAFTKVIETDLTEKQRKIVLDTLQGVILQSPVDTGSFRASHRVSINQPDMSFNKADKDKGGSTTISKGRSLLSSLVPFSTVYIQTNAPYATKIEFGGFTTKSETDKTSGGYSKQAPQGVYGLTFNYIVQKYGG